MFVFVVLVKCAWNTFPSYATMVSHPTSCPTVPPWHRMLGLGPSVCPSAKCDPVGQPITCVWSEESASQAGLNVWASPEWKTSFSQILWITLLTMSLHCQKDQSCVCSPPLASMYNREGMCINLMGSLIFFCLLVGWFNYTSLSQLYHGYFFF